ncbi:putative ribose-phosphate pyrophosphokinase [Trabzonvirus APT65]|uniref:Ribose-phosphate pyrophosphokinase n=1 Tax=Aeromonas phage APT65 TaxID=2982914 RepID=A0A9E8JZQ9_9CAUD|nr:putative ribose-phosphate pyrophosphokinase [Aeromonas phage APT65]
MIKINFIPPHTTEQKPISFKEWEFPAGEVGVRLGDEARGYKGCEWFIAWHFESTKETSLLGNLVDAIRHVDSDAILNLSVPYLPFSRQDRAVHYGDSFALKEFGRVLNGMAFSRVTTWDVHSDVAQKVVERLNDIPQQAWGSLLIDNHEFTHVIAPDAGAAKKIYKSTNGKHVEVIVCSKARDETGAVIGLDVEVGEVKRGNKYLVLDDICDGGATFNFLAKELEIPSDQMHLYTTHGIYSRGLDDLLSNYSSVFTANLMSKDEFTINMFKKDDKCPLLFVAHG